MAGLQNLSKCIALPQMALMARNTKKSVLSMLVRSIATEQRIADLGYKLPAVNPPKGNFVLVKRVGNLLYTAGHLPQPADGDLMLGKVGDDVTIEEGYKAAQYVGLNILATVKEEVGDLDKVKNIVKLMGFVNCTDGFAAQPQIVNGCSDLFVEIFGEKGQHSRSAVGTNALPVNVPVEIEAIIEIEE
mmetsp:Transcript_36310/g.47887  ORF Transcript_36310/g.47887 Transcript_36310/m.47887 type:complete len:188 (+) Transcript_36310:81-644(+)